MSYIVQYDKRVADNTWLEGIQRTFRYEIEAAKYGRELIRSEDNTNIKVFEV